MRYSLNYGSVKESGNFELIPEGEYTARISKVTTTDKTGNPIVTSNGDSMVRLHLEIQDGPLQGQKLFHNVIFFPEGKPGAGMTKHFLKVIGEKEGPDGRIEVDPVMWESRANPFKVRVKHETYEGVTRAKVANVDYLVKMAEVEQGLDL